MSLAVDPATLSPSGWYCSDNISGADGAAVATWSDLSGNGRDLTQGTEASKPLIYRHGINGRRFLVFDGTDDFFVSAVNLSAFLGTNGIGTALAVFVVPDTASATSVNPLWAAAVGAGTGTALIYDLLASPDKLKARMGTAGLAEKVLLGRRLGTTTGGYAVNGLHVAVWQHTVGDYVGVGIDNLDDAALVVPASSPGADTTTGNLLRVGRDEGTAYFKGSIYELIFFPTVLTQAQRRGVQLYLTQKYAIEYRSGIAAGEAAEPTYRVDMRLPSTALAHDATLSVGLGLRQGGPIPPPTLWLKADALTLNNNDLVSSWPDSSGAARDLSAAGAARPTFKTAVVNGKPAVLFNGTGNYMTGTATIADLLGKGGRGTVYAVCRVDSGGGTRSHTLWTANGASPACRMFVYEEPSGPTATLKCGNDDGGVEDAASKAAAFGSFHVARWAHDLAGGSIYADNVVAAWDALKYAGGVSQQTGATADLTQTQAIGAHAQSGTNYLNGYIAELLVYDVVHNQPQSLHVLSYLAAKYGITYPYASEGYQKAWVDVTADVRADVLELGYGIKGGGFNDRVGDIGELSLTMENSVANSGGVVGYYSPQHASRRPGWGLGVETRVALTYYGTTYYKWKGRVTDVKPAPGKEDYRAEVMALDYMDELARMTMPRLAIEFSKTSTDILNKVMLYVPTLPHSMEFDVGTQTYAFVYDNTQDEDVKALTEVSRASASELGYCFVKGDATQGACLTFQNATHRATDTVVIWALPKPMNLDPVHSVDDVQNHVLAKLYPRRVAPSPEVIFTLGEKYSLFSGEPNLIFTVPYRGSASGGARRVGAKDMITPVQGTDYRFTQNQDGTGSDWSADLQVDVIFGANSAEVSLYNGGAHTGYVSLFQLRGTPLYTYESITVDRKDTTSIAAYGEQTLPIELPYATDVRLVKTQADAILTRYKDPHTWVRSVSFFVEDSESAMHALAREPGDRISLSEDTSGLSASQYHIQSVRLAIDEERKILVTWGLAPGE